MTSTERLAKLAKPTSKARLRFARTGDGDLCPLDPKHGPMLVLRLAPGGDTAPRQYCPSQVHDGRSSQPAERCRWPFDYAEGDLDRLVGVERTRLANLQAVAS